MSLRDGEKVFVLVDKQWIEMTIEDWINPDDFGLVKDMPDHRYRTIRSLSREGIDWKQIN